jgi:hypothetical protein
MYSGDSELWGQQNLPSVKAGHLLEIWQQTTAFKPLKHDSKLN